MAMVKFTTRLEGMERLQRMLYRLRTRVGNVEPWYRRYLDPSVSRYFRMVWQTQGGINGRRWAQLSRQTVFFRERHGTNIEGTDKPLLDAGKLRRAWTGGWGVKKQMDPLRYRRRVMPKLARITAFHQYGYEVKHFGGQRFGSVPELGRTREVPARPIIPDRFPRSIVGSWERSLAKWALEVTGQQHFRVYGNRSRGGRGLPG